MWGQTLTANTINTEALCFSYMSPSPSIAENTLPIAYAVLVLLITLISGKHAFCRKTDVEFDKVYL